tara:strand:- start:5330 stop:5452 length:123 start_codon:yes stop_codon:yes gene_type:complete
MLYDFGDIIMKRLVSGFAVMITALLMVAPKPASPKWRLNG